MVKNQYQYHLPENFHRPKFPYKWSALLPVSRAECFKRKFVFCLFKPTELVCAHGKRDPGIKFTGLEFCLPFTQTVNWPVFPCKWLWEMVNNLYFRMKQKKEVKSLDFGNWHFIQYFTKWTICNTFVQKCVTRILSTVPNTQNDQKSFGYKNKILVGKHYVHMLHWNKHF